MWTRVPSHLSAITYRAALLHTGRFFHTLHNPQKQKGKPRANLPRPTTVPHDSGCPRSLAFGDQGKLQTQPLLVSARTEGAPSKQRSTRIGWESNEPAHFRNQHEIQIPILHSANKKPVHCIHAPLNRPTLFQEQRAHRYVPTRAPTPRSLEPRRPRPRLLRVHRRASAHRPLSTTARRSARCRLRRAPPALSRKSCRLRCRLAQARR